MPHESRADLTPFTSHPFVPPTEDVSQTKLIKRTNAETIDIFLLVIALFLIIPSFSVEGLFVNLPHTSMLSASFSMGSFL